MSSLLDSISYFPGLDSPFSPLPDVSTSAPPMTSSTPTGNGTGEWLSADWQKFLIGGLQTGLNYAIQRDQAQIAADTAANLSYYQAASAQANVGYQAQQANSNRKLIWGAMAVGALLLVMRK